MPLLRNGIDIHCITMIGTIIKIFERWYNNIYDDEIWFRYTKPYFPCMNRKKNFCEICLGQNKNIKHTFPYLFTIIGCVIFTVGVIDLCDVL